MDEPTLHALLVRDVELEAEDLRVPGRLEVATSDARPEPHERLGESGPDAAPRPCDQGDASLDARELYGQMPRQETIPVKIAAGHADVKPHLLPRMGAAA
jgi:hypothetical protein